MFDKSGLLLLNKPSGISSYDCIRHIKKIIKEKKLKIGHAGTLDEFASGLMIVAIGRQATKQLTTLLTETKEYIAKGKLGELTDTLDYTGRIIHEAPWSHVTQEHIEQALKQFAEHYEQIPPAFSALKHQGTSLYKLARKDALSSEDFATILESKKRLVTITAHEILSFEPPFFTIKVTVSKGTYIRSLVNDLAQHIGSCATTYELQRTKIGTFSLEQACALADIQSVSDIERYLFS